MRAQQPLFRADARNERRDEECREQDIVTAPRSFSASPMHSQMQSSRLAGALARPPTAPVVLEMWALVGLPSSLRVWTVARRIRLGEPPPESAPLPGGFRR